MRKTYIILLFLASAMGSCNNTKETKGDTDFINFQVSNPLAQMRTNTTVLIPLEELISAFPEAEAFRVEMDGNELPNQLIKMGPQQGLLVLISEISGGGSSELQLTPVHPDSATVFPKRTQAEISIKEGGEWQGREYMGGSFKNIDSLRVPDEHTDHSWFIRYEGPGWESDLVGYRFYLDWRNATDVFGKTTDQMVLQNVGQDGFDSYHEMQDWGMDVLKVGSSLGIGAPAFLSDSGAVRIDSTDSIFSKVLINGSIYSSIETNYYGWEVSDTKLDVTSWYSIHAGSRLTHHKLVYEGSVNNLATGIGKSDSIELFTSTGSPESFGYIATYGNQSLNNDNLGLAVLFSSEYQPQVTEDEFSHVVKLKPIQNGIDYYFLAAWELEKEGIKTKDEFVSYVKAKAAELANPLELTLPKKSAN